MTDEKTVSPAQHLQMLALFTIAKQHADKAQQFVSALKEMSGADTDHFEDGIWDGRGREFDEIFRNAGFAVRKAEG